MQNFRFKIDPQSKTPYIETTLSGKLLISNTMLNKGTAFSMEERMTFELLGQLPNKVETLDEQVRRAYEQLQRYETNLSKNIYLNNLMDRNETLFYALAKDHIQQILPIIYTPIVGTAVKQFSREFRSPRGLYVSYADRDHLETILNNRTYEEIDLTVISDAEAILGIGDQGVGGMDIPIAKLMVYTLCAGINPSRTLPVLLDVGTDNEQLLADPLYLGWRHKRIRGQEYDDFVDQFVQLLKKKFPRIFLHWEDFSNVNARKLLNRYRDEVCSFNDDIQGTGVVAVAAILSGAKVNQQSLVDQRIVIFGAGAAGVGIADQVVDAMVRMGISREAACEKFWLIDREGLLTVDQDLKDFQKPYAKAIQPTRMGLLDVVNMVKPTVLIGCSTVAGAFSEIIIRAMAQHLNQQRPIILPLSNPTERAEARPEDLLEWTEGNALIATGSPFGTVTWRNQPIEIAQCNNALAFPGIGLGIIATHASKVSEAMLWAACDALSDLSPALTSVAVNSPLLPSLQDSQQVAKAIAKEVIKVVVDEKINRRDPLAIEEIQWEAKYLKMVKL